MQHVGMLREFMPQDGMNWQSARAEAVVATEPSILVTGAGSGLGRACAERFSAIGLTRANRDEVLRSLATEGADIILHCAFNQTKDPTTQQLSPLLEDNLEFLRRLLSLPHRQFVFISTIDVYPRDGRRYLEEDPLPLEPLTFYAAQKLLCEAMVCQSSSQALILRAGAMIGPTARPSNLMRLLGEQGPRLSLTAGSRLNVVLHEAVLDFIALGLERSLSGVYNLCAASSVTLQEVAEALERTPVYGSFSYQTPEADNSKAGRLCDLFTRTSLDNVRHYAGGRG